VTVKGIWHYINLETPIDQLLAMPEPMAPVLPDRVDDKQKPINLYRLQYQVYQMAIEQYKAV
jgi:hypothetical protein